MIKTSDILETIRAVESINYFDNEIEKIEPLETSEDDGVYVYNDPETIRGIEEDIKLLDPKADERLFKQKQKRYRDRCNYQRMMYIKRVNKL